LICKKVRQRQQLSGTEIQCLNTETEFTTVYSTFLLGLHACVPGEIRHALFTLSVQVFSIFLFSSTLLHMEKMVVMHSIIGAPFVRPGFCQLSGGGGATLGVSLPRVEPFHAGQLGEGTLQSTYMYIYILHTPPQLIIFINTTVYSTYRTLKKCTLYLWYTYIYICTLIFGMLDGNNDN
jgi:hypothetical protein